MKEIFTFGAGGAVVRENKILLVHHNYGDFKWYLPGGHVRFDELPIDAAVREVYEETKIQVKVHGLISLRNRVDERGNDVCFIYYMTPVDNREPEPDGREIDKTGYYSLEEMQGMENVWQWPVWIAKTIFEEKQVLLTNRGDPQNLDRKFQVFL